MRLADIIIAIGAILLLTAGINIAGVVGATRAIGGADVGVVMSTGGTNLDEVNPPALKTLNLPAAVQTTEPTLPAPIQIRLEPLGGSGENGTAQLTALDPTKVLVDITVFGEPAGESQAAAIHKGSCANMDPSPSFNLNPVVDGVSTTVIDANLQIFTTQQWAIEGHRTANNTTTLVFCGTLGAAAQATSTASATATPLSSPTTAPTAVATVTSTTLPSATATATATRIPTTATATQTATRAPTTRVPTTAAATQVPTKAPTAKATPSTVPVGGAELYDPMIMVELVLGSLFVSSGLIMRRFAR